MPRRPSRRTSAAALTAGALLAVSACASQPTSSHSGAVAATVAPSSAGHTSQASPTGAPSATVPVPVAPTTQPAHASSPATDPSRAATTAPPSSPSAAVPAPTRPPVQARATAAHQAGTIYNCGLTSSRVLLTFDDWAYGDPYRAVRIGAYLQKLHIRAAFFLINEYAKRYPDIVRELRAQGHWVGNHTYSHPDLSTLSAASIKWQIQHGLPTNVLRPPYGSADTTVRTVAASLGYHLCDWTVDTQDWQFTKGHYKSATAIRTTVRNAPLSTLKGGVILGHLFSNYPREVPTLIADLERRGLKLCANTGPVGATMPIHPTCGA